MPSGKTKLKNIHWILMFFSCCYQPLHVFFTTDKEKLNKWSKNSHDSPHNMEDFSLGKFNVTLNCFCGWPIGMLANTMWGNSNVRVIGNGAWWEAGNFRHHPLKSAPSCGDQFLWPIQVQITNGISISSADFIGLVVITDTLTDSPSVATGHI